MPGPRSPSVNEPVREPGEPALDVVIAGGGVAALETALSVHALAGDRVKLTLLAPAAEFVYRPVAVLEPFLRIPPRRLALKKVADELNATLEQDTVAGVDRDRRVLRTGADRQLRYDALVIAVGARVTEAPPGLLALDVGHMDESLRKVIEKIDAGSIRRLALRLRGRRGRCPPTSSRSSPSGTLGSGTSSSISPSSPVSRGRWTSSAPPSARRLPMRWRRPVSRHWSMRRSSRPRAG